MSGVDDGTDGVEVSNRVLAAFLLLKQENSSCELKRIDGGYYVYLSSGRRDSETGKVRKISIYKGRITPEGVFIPVKRKKGSVLREFAKRTNNGISIPEEGNADSIQNTNTDTRQESLKYEKTILTALSMNGRISMPALSRMLGLSVNATAWHVKSMEKKYGIKYIPEIDVTKFGYMQFLVTVKFLEGVPSAGELRAVVFNEPRVQLAMLAKGESDLLVYVLAKTVKEASDLIVNMRNKLSTYCSVWSTIPIYEDYGFVALRDEFIDMLKSNGELLEREYAVLKALNADASVEFSKIDQKYSFDSGRASYSYYKLKNEGKIRRVTITMQKTPMRYMGVILETILYKSKFLEHRPEVLSNVIEECEVPTNKYSAVYDTISPDGVIFFVPVYEYDELDKTAENIQHLDLGVKLTTLIVSNTLVGNFSYRHFDNAHSVQQEILENEYGMPKLDRRDYEETGRKKAKKVQLDVRGARITNEEIDLSQTLP